MNLSGDIALARISSDNIFSGTVGRFLGIDEENRYIYYYYNEPTLGFGNDPNDGRAEQSCYLTRFDLDSKSLLNTWELTDMRTTAFGSTFHNPYFDIKNNKMYVAADAKDAYTGATSDANVLTSFPDGATTRIFEVDLTDGSYIDLGSFDHTKEITTRTTTIIYFNQDLQEIYFFLNNDTIQLLIKRNFVSNTTDIWDSLTENLQINAHPFLFNESTKVAHLGMRDSVSDNIRCVVFNFDTMTFVKKSNEVLNANYVSNVNNKNYNPNFFKLFYIDSESYLRLLTTNEDFDTLYLTAQNESEVYGGYQPRFLSEKETCYPVRQSTFRPLILEQINKSKGLLSGDVLYDSYYFQNIGSSNSLRNAEVIVDEDAGYVFYYTIGELNNARPPAFNSNSALKIGCIKLSDNSVQFKEFDFNLYGGLESGGNANICYYDIETKKLYGFCYNHSNSKISFFSIDVDYNNLSSSSINILLADAETAFGTILKEPMTIFYVDTINNFVYFGKSGGVYKSNYNTNTQIYFIGLGLAGSPLTRSLFFDINTETAYILGTSNANVTFLITIDFNNETVTYSDNFITGKVFDSALQSIDIEKQEIIFGGRFSSPSKQEFLICDFNLNIKHSVLSTLELFRGFGFTKNREIYGFTTNTNFYKLRPEQMTKTIPLIQPI